MVDAPLRWDVKLHAHLVGPFGQHFEKVFIDEAVDLRRQDVTLPIVLIDRSSDRIFSSKNHPDLYKLEPCVPCKYS